VAPAGSEERSTANKAKRERGSSPGARALYLSSSLNMVRELCAGE